MAKNPLVSVCMPNYNGSRFLLKSLRSILGQTYRNIEVVFVDDASRDDSLEIVGRIKDKRIRVYSNKKNSGFSAASNRAISLAKGKYVALYHSDDIYEPTIIEEQVSALEKNPGLGGVFALARVIDSNGNVLYNKPFPFKLRKKLFYGGKEEIYPLMLEHGNFFMSPTAMIRRDVYKSTGGFSKGLIYAEDQEMWIRILEKYKLGIINKRLMRYRIHGMQLSSTYNQLREDLSLEYVIFDRLIVSRKKVTDPAVLKIYSKNKSKSYIFSAVGALLKKKGKKKEYNIRKSKETFYFSFFSVFGIIQRVMSLRINFILRPCIKLCFMAMKIAGLQKKLNFLNYV